MVQPSSSSDVAPTHLSRCALRDATHPCRPSSAALAASQPTQVDPLVTTLSSLWSGTSPSPLMTDTSANRSAPCGRARRDAGGFRLTANTGSALYISERAHAGELTCPREAYVHPHPSCNRSIGSCRRGRNGPSSERIPFDSLNSGQEPTGGEAGGHGFFSYTIDGTEFCWTLSWRGHRRSGRRPRPRRPAPCCRRDRHRPRHRRCGRPGPNRLPCDHRGVGCGHHLQPWSLLRQPAQRWLPSRGHPRSAQVADVDSSRCAS
jgi:hypothetical protein